VATCVPRVYTLAAVQSRLKILPLHVLSLYKVSYSSFFLFSNNTYLAFRSLNSSHSPRILLENRNIKEICNTISSQRTIVSTTTLYFKAIKHHTHQPYVCGKSMVHWKTKKKQDSCRLKTYSVKKEPRLLKENMVNFANTHVNWS